VTSTKGDAARIAELEAALQEANETLDAIRNGDVDAVVVGGDEGQVVYTLESADRPYRVLVEQMREGAITLSGDGTILYCNQSFADLVGEPSQGMVGGSFFDRIEDRAGLSQMLVPGGAGRSKEMVLRAIDGRAVPANVSIAELAAEGEQPIFCGIVTDLTHNYDRARDLADANARLETEIAERTRAEQSLSIALEAADMGSWDLGIGYDSVVRTARHDAIYGYDPPAPRWTLEGALEHFVPEDRDAMSNAFRTAVETGRVDIEKRIRRAGDGALRWVHIIGRTFTGPAGPERIAGVIFDVTDRRLIEEQLRQGQKMEAIGQLTGGIAHDFNNLLMIIGGSLESLSRRVTLDERVQKLLDAARTGVARGAKLNEQLLAFARRQDMREEVVCLNDLLPTFETLLDRAVGETVTIDIEQAHQLWSCKVDPHQLETAILNLAINGRDAMNCSGTLRLATANAHISEEEAKRFEAACGDYVKVSVSDDGTGMDADVAARVFEPFFTTKEVGKGTGLGLSQVYGFAKQSNGFVSLDSHVGEGTTVSIYLPRTAPEPKTQAVAPAPAPSRDARGTVFLVEDDPDVRQATRAMLEELGYTVREAGSGRQALDALKEDAQADVVFTDVIMASGMSGIELARAIKAEYPQMPVLLTSGYTAQRLVPTAMNGDLPLLRKPYTLAELSKGLTDLIG
jgi:PAS domain S-box-containing protein